MKEKQVKMILVGLVLGAFGMSLFLLRKNLVQEKTGLVVSPADFVDSKRHALDLLGGLVILVCSVSLLASKASEVGAL